VGTGSLPVQTGQLQFTLGRSTLILPFLTRESGWREHNDKHYIFDTITTIIDPQNFVECAFGMLNGGKTDRNESASALTQMRHFCSHFGTTPRTCATIWEHLMSNGAHGARPKHLLWALLLFKLYLLENGNAAMTGADEKTFRKWSWLVVGLIIDIKEELMSAAQ
jgi:hypothetical protein